MVLQYLSGLFRKAHKGFRLLVLGQVLAAAKGEAASAIGDKQAAQGQTRIMPSMP